MEPNRQRDKGMNNTILQEIISLISLYRASADKMINTPGVEDWETIECLQECLDKIVKIVETS